MTGAPCEKRVFYLWSAFWVSEFCCAEFRYPESRHPEELPAVAPAQLLNPAEGFLAQITVLPLPPRSC